MSVTSGTVKLRRGCDGTTTSWSYTLHGVADESHIAVYHVATSSGQDVPTRLVRDTHYGIVLTDDGFDLTYPLGYSPAPFDTTGAVGEHLVITLEPPYDQTGVIRYKTARSVEDIGRTMDALSYRIKRLADDVSRCVRLDVADSRDPEVVTFDGLVRSPVLLDSATGAGEVSVTLTSVNWPATYGYLRVEADVSDYSGSGDTLYMQPIDDGSAVTAGLNGNSHIANSLGSTQAPGAFWVLNKFLGSSGWPSTATARVFPAPNDTCCFTSFAASNGIFDAPSVYFSGGIMTGTGTSMDGVKIIGDGSDLFDSASFKLFGYLKE